LENCSSVIRFQMKYFRISKLLCHMKIQEFDTPNIKGPMCVWNFLFSKNRKGAGKGREKGTPLGIQNRKGAGKGQEKGTPLGIQNAAQCPRIFRCGNICLFHSLNFQIFF
jgi:hypothetical protein